MTTSRKPKSKGVYVDANAAVWHGGRLVQHVHCRTSTDANGPTVEEVFQQEAVRWSSLMDRLEESGD